MCKCFWLTEILTVSQTGLQRRKFYELFFLNGTITKSQQKIYILVSQLWAPVFPLMPLHLFIC